VDPRSPPWDSAAISQSNHNLGLGIEFKNNEGVVATPFCLLHTWKMGRGVGESQLVLFLFCAVFEAWRKIS
jgi:hypothetical protein